MLLYLTAFFLPATVFGLPLRVRALVLVRWPLTGRPCKAAWSLVSPGHVASRQAAFTLTADCMHMQHGVVLALLKDPHWVGSMLSTEHTVELAGHLP